ncbi:hypothetical protein QBC35DRAFT_501456 [Podospora australis]|uniref:Uncharacterized protein n=1 Tax=Podospora australis TaxID=1536484 RepID=A0AAN6WQN9_9PEZI|nr:hypothetical protein QBC35DRAFT_501456 [Podospora australis]
MSPRTQCTCKSRMTVNPDTVTTLSRTNLQKFDSAKRQEIARQRGHSTPPPSPDIHDYASDASWIERPWVGPRAVRLTISEEAELNAAIARHEAKLYGEGYFEQLDGGSPPAAGNNPVSTIEAPLEIHNGNISISPFTDSKGGGHYHDTGHFQGIDQDAANPNIQLPSMKLAEDDLAEDPESNIQTAKHMMDNNQADINPTLETDHYEVVPELEETEAVHEDLGENNTEGMEDQSMGEDEFYENFPEYNPRTGRLYTPDPELPTTRPSIPRNPRSDVLDTLPGGVELPPDFPAYHCTQNMNEIAAYLANASYVASLSGPPLNDMKYGIFIVAAGSEHLLFGSPSTPGFAITREFIEAVDDANQDYQKALRMHDLDKDSEGFVAHRFADDFHSVATRDQRNVDLFATPPKVGEKGEQYDEGAEETAAMEGSVAAVEFKSGVKRKRNSVSLSGHYRRTINNCPEHSTQDTKHHHQVSVRVGIRE